MIRLLRIVAIVVAAGLVLAVAALVALPYLIDTPRVQALVARTAGQTLGRPVKFAAMSVSVLPLPAVVLRDLEVAEDPAFGPGPFLKLGAMRIRLKLRPLLSLRVELGDFVLEKPAIALVQAADGRWNFATLGPAAAGGGPATQPRAGSRPGPAAGATAFLGSRVRIADGVVTYEARGGRAPARYRLEGLDLRLAGAGGALTFSGSARVEPGALAVKIDEGRVELSGARTLMAAPLRGTVSLDGRNLGALVAARLGPEPAVAGAVKGRLVLGGSVGGVKATGDVTVAGLAVTQTRAQCPEPRRRTLSLGTVQSPLAWEEPTLTARPVTTSLGGGTVSASVTATLDHGVRVRVADIAVKGMPVEMVLVDFLCQGYAVSGPLELTGQASARANDLWKTLDGTGRLRIGPGKVVGAQALALLAGVARVGGAASALLGAELPASGLASSFAYESITGTYTITDGVLSTRDLTLTSPTLGAVVAGTYGLASGAVNADVTLTSGRTQLRAKVTGPAANPSIRVDPSTALRNVDPARVEKSLRDLLKKFR